jgi:hypothetical protein
MNKRSRTDKPVYTMAIKVYIQSKNLLTLEHVFHLLHFIITFAVY